MRYTHFLWDWNGTLVDDLICAREAVNDILRERGRPLISTAQYHSYIDTPIRKFYEHLFDLEQEDYNEILAVYNQYYRNRMLQYGKLRNGAKELLESAKQHKIHQWTVTASHTDDVVTYLNRFGILPYFDYVLGAENRFADSKVERVRKQLQEQHIEPSRVLVIGDTLHDLEMAAECGTDCALLLDGHQAKQHLEAAHHNVFASIPDLQRSLGL